MGMDPTELVHRHYPGFRSIMLGGATFGYCSDLKGVKKFLNHILPDDVHDRTRGKFHTAVAKWPCLGFEFLGDFPSKEALINGVLCSMTLVPGFAWRPRARYPFN
jgi:hypothetical protein